MTGWINCTFSALPALSWQASLADGTTLLIPPVDGLRIFLVLFVSKIFINAKGKVVILFNTEALDNHCRLVQTGT